MSLEEFNGVRSNIIDQQTDPPVGTVSRNSTFIFGTAKSGPKHKPTVVTVENVREIFGDVPTDSSFDTSLVRGYYEYVQSCRGTPDVSLVRVGTTSHARVDLYENVAYLSGETSYTMDGNTPSKSMFIQAIQEGAEMNKTLVNIVEDENQKPIFMKIELPDGITAGYNLAISSNAAGVVTKVSDLCRLINSNNNINTKVFAGFTALQADVEIEILEVDGYKQRTYDLTPPVQANVSWGDKIVNIQEAYIQKNVEFNIDAGSLVAELDILPEKDMNESVHTISDFIRLSNNESVLTVSPDMIGQINHELDLACVGISGWDNNYAITGSVDHAWDFQLRVRRSGSTSSTLLEKDTHYSIVAATGKLTIIESLKLGDRYFASYRFKINYQEAKLRSDLTSGSDRSYFIFGDQIIFGANQPSNLIIYYDAKVNIDSSGIRIDSFTKPIITFTNVDTLPEAGEIITLTILHEPELPAGSGVVLPGNVTQPGGLSGGTDGRLITKKTYLKNLKAAMVGVDLYPRRHNVVMGMWLDEIQPGYNPETGLPEDLPVNMWKDILPYIDRSSNLSNECDLYIPVTPLNDLTQDSVSRWVKRLSDNSDTDISRPANIIDSINNFRADCPLGVFVVSMPEINNGRRYYANPAKIYAGYKQNLAYDKSATHDFVPGNVQDLGVKVFNAEVIGKLNQKRYTTAIVDYTGRYIWADAPTLGLKYRSQFDRQFVRDTVYLAVSMTREVAERYIGMPRLPQYLLSMKKDVSKAIDMLVPEVISDFYVDLVPIPDGYITGKTKLKLFLVTAKEIRSVEIETSISLSQ